MRFQNVAKAISGITLALVLSSPLLASGPAYASEPVSSTVNWYAPDRTSTLLRQLQDLNEKLTNDGQTLKTFTRSMQFNWKSHAFYLNSVRDNINEVGSMLRELQSIRHGALPWQQQAVDRIHPIAATLAAHTQAAIEHLRENQNRLLVPQYTNHLTGIADRADQMRETVKNFINYGETQKELQRLQGLLEL